MAHHVALSFSKSEELEIGKAEAVNWPQLRNRGIVASVLFALLATPTSARAIEPGFDPNLQTRIEQNIPSQHFNIPNTPRTAKPRVRTPEGYAKKKPAIRKPRVAAPE